MNGDGGTWVGSPEALTETAAERRLLSPAAEIAPAHFYPRHRVTRTQIGTGSVAICQLVELSGFSRSERSAGSTADSSFDSNGALS